MNLPLFKEAAQSKESFLEPPPKSIDVVGRVVKEPGWRHIPIGIGLNAWQDAVFPELEKAMIGKAALPDAVSAAVKAGDAVLARTKR